MCFVLYTIHYILYYNMIYFTIRYDTIRCYAMPGSRQACGRPDREPDECQQRGEDLGGLQPFHDLII